MNWLIKTHSVEISPSGHWMVFRQNAAACRLGWTLVVCAVVGTFVFLSVVGLLKYEGDRYAAYMVAPGVLIVMFVIAGCLINKQRIIRLEDDRVTVTRGSWIFRTQFDSHLSEYKGFTCTRRGLDLTGVVRFLGPVSLWLLGLVPRGPEAAGLLEDKSVELSVFWLIHATDVARNLELLKCGPLEQAAELSSVLSEKFKLPDLSRE